MPDPVYTPQNCIFAGELQWGLSVFWRNNALEASWLDDLKEALTADDIELKSHRPAGPRVSQFEIDSGYDVSPLFIVQRVKGRLRHLLRHCSPKPFRRNYAIRSIGRVTREVIEQYVESQTKRHLMSDEVVQRRFERFQISRPHVDLSQPQATSHGRYWYNLHLTIARHERHQEIREDLLSRTREMILATSRARGHLLSRGGILPDHVHLALGCPLAVTPADIATCYMNNIAFIYDMDPVFQFGAHLRTFSEYHLGAIKNPTSR